MTTPKIVLDAARLQNIIKMAARMGFGSTRLLRTLRQTYVVGRTQLYYRIYRSYEGTHARREFLAIAGEHALIPRTQYIENPFVQVKDYQYRVRLTGVDAYGIQIDEDYITVRSDIPLTPTQADYLGVAEQERWGSPPMEGIISGEVVEAFHKEGAPWL